MRVDLSRAVAVAAFLAHWFNPYKCWPMERGVHATSRARQGAEGKGAGTMVLKVIAAPSCPGWTRAVLIMMAIMGTALAVASREF